MTRMMRIKVGPCGTIPTVGASPCGCPQMYSTLLLGYHKGLPLQAKHSASLLGYSFYTPLRSTPSINRGRASGGQLSTALVVPVGRTFCSGSITGYQQQFILFFRSKPGRSSNNIGRESHSFHIPPIPKDWCPDKNEQQKRGATAWPPLLGFIHSPGMEITLPELSYPG